MGDLLLGRGQFRWGGGGGGTFGTFYNGDYQTLLHTKHGSSGPSGFREEDLFIVFPIVSLWELPVAMETTILIQSAPKPMQSIPQPNDGSY